jgi:YggT family protein
VLTMTLGIVDYLLYLLGIVIVIQFVMSLLISFNVINTYNEFVRTIWTALEKMTEPLYRPIRRILPDFGAIDFSPMVVIILITILRNFVIPAIAQAAY